MYRSFLYGIAVASLMALTPSIHVSPHGLSIGAPTAQAQEHGKGGSGGHEEGGGCGGGGCSGGGAGAFGAGAKGFGKWAHPLKSAVAPAKAMACHRRDVRFGRRLAIMPTSVTGVRPMGNIGYKSSPRYSAMQWQPQRA